MCMILATGSQRVRRYAVNLRKPLTVYKVLHDRTHLMPGQVVSPYQKHYYYLGKTEKASIGAYTDEDGNRIVWSGIHSFVHLADAWKESDKMNDMFSGFMKNAVAKYKVYRCEIPRFSKYYRGYWNYTYPNFVIENIVSSALTVVEEVNLSGGYGKQTI